MNPRNRLAEVEARRAAIQAEVVALDSLETPTDDEATRAESLSTEFADLETEGAALRAKIEKLDAVRSASIDPTKVEPAFHVPNVIVRNDPFDNIGQIDRADASEQVSRAMSAIESLGRKMPEVDGEEVARKVENISGVARHVLLTGSPAYRSAFQEYMATQGRPNYTAEEAQAVRAALSLTSANGGYSLPFNLDPTLIYTGTASKNPLRRISRVEQGTSDKWNGVTASAVTTYWKAEGSAFTDGSPTTGGPSVDAAMLTAYVTGSYEIFQDSNLLSQLPALIGEAFEFEEGAAFVTGSGSNAPKGIITAISATAASTVTATTRGQFNTASAVDVFALLNAVPSRFEDSATWVGNKATFNNIKQMSTASNGSYFWSDFNAAVGSPLLGSPIAQSSTMATAQTSGTILLVLGDFSRFLIYDRLGTQVEYIQNVVDGSGLPTGQRGLVAYKRVGSDCLDINAFRFLKT